MSTETATFTRRGNLVIRTNTGDDPLIVVGRYPDLNVRKLHPKTNGRTLAYQGLLRVHLDSRRFLLKSERELMPLWPVSVADLNPRLGALSPETQKVFDNWFASIPAGLTGNISQFGFGQGLLLQLAAVAPQPFLDDLLESNPALALLLAVGVRMIDPPQRLKTIRCWAELKQHKLVAFPSVGGSRRSARILRKIPARAMSRFWVPLAVSMAAEQDQHPARKLLNHLSTIDASVASLLHRGYSGSLFNLLTRTAIEQVVATTPHPGLIHPALLTLKNVVSMEMAAGRNPYRRRFRSLDSIRKCADSLMEKLGNEESWVEDCRLPLPSAPFPGIRGVLWSARSVGMVRDWGRHFQNCLTTRCLSDLLSSQAALYRLTGPDGEEALLRLVRGQRRSWSIAELKGLRNRAVRKSTKRFAEEWVNLMNGEEGD